MSGYLLDTNVPSEFSRDRLEPRVVQWLKAQPPAMLFLSAVTIGEIRKGPKAAAAPGWKFGFARTF